MRFIIPLAGLAIAMAAPATAATNFTSDFDAFTLGSPGWGTFSSVDGWTGGPLGIEVQSNGVAGSPSSGTNLIELDTSANSSMSRTIDAGVYSLTFDYSARPGTAASTNGIGVYLGSTLLGTFSGNGTAKSDTNWLTISLDFTAASSSTLKFAALGTSDGQGGYLDSIGLVGSALPLPVPEPAEWAMLVAGLGAVGFVGRRRGPQGRS